MRRKHYHGFRKLNLGAGLEAKINPDWVNVDFIKTEGVDVIHNLMYLPWPFEDSSASEIKAIDLLEHLPIHTNEYEPTYIKFIEECWRILKPEGKLTIQVPRFDSPNLPIDPTHTRGFDPKSFNYFDPDTDLGKWYGYYSDKKFKVSTTESNGNITFIMIKI